MSRHLFFAANTPDGFYQCFDDIMFLDEAQKIIYLKGSSGCGKSTLMKKVASAFENMGSSVDYIHCSNNITDLDGICVRDYGLSIIDATAPHVCDPSVPVAIDEILNLADYIGREQIAVHAGELLELSEQKKPYYEKACRYLSAAYVIYRNNHSIRERLLNKGELNSIIDRETAGLALQPTEKPGRNRRMFAGAVTPQGLTNYLDTMLDGYSIVRIDGEDGTGSGALLAQIQKTANEGGLDTETCYSPWNTTKAEHLFIPELHICYLTKHEYCSVTENVLRVIDLNSLCDTTELAKYNEELAYNKKLFDELLVKSMKMMADQKIVHDRVEEIYVPCMDFESINAYTLNLIGRLTALPDKRE